MGKRIVAVNTGTRMGSEAFRTKIRWCILMKPGIKRK